MVEEKTDPRERDERKRWWVWDEFLGTLEGSMFPVVVTTLFIMVMLLIICAVSTQACSTNISVANITNYSPNNLGNSENSTGLAIWLMLMFLVISVSISLLSC
jgi:hypothetical protein